LELFRMVVGAPVEAVVLSHGSWTAGHSVVAELLRKSWVFIGGHSVQLLTPDVGRGAITAFEKAHNAGWMLAPVLKGKDGRAMTAIYSPPPAAWATTRPSKTR